MRVRVRPEKLVRAFPEVIGEVVGVGRDHGFDAGVDDGEGIVGPEVSANVGEVLVLEEETVTEIAVEDELSLYSVSVTGDVGLLSYRYTHWRCDELCDMLM